MDNTHDRAAWVPGMQDIPGPTLSAIARQAGVSRSTVSRVLNYSTRISAATTQRVREAAQALGYRPNPLLSMLMERVRVGKNVGYQGTIAVVTEFEDPTRWYATAWEGVHRGALERASERGYTLEFFSTRTFDPQGRRLSQILHSRGIHGVYITPGFRDRRVNLDWTLFSAATTGHGLLNPLLHRICYHNYHGIQLVCRRLQELGYQRIGLYLEQRNHEVTDHNYVAGYLLFLESVPATSQLRPFLVPRYTRESFLDWFDQYRPDAVISSTHELVEWAADQGIRSPDDFGFVHLDHSSQRSDCAGIDHNNRLIGRAVIDLIVAQIQRCETGIPIHPMTTMVEGYWVEGSTVRPQTRSGRRRRSLNLAPS